ncbi:nucleoside triphosphate pyrophosphohydrolase [Thalassobacillus sp. CUG 92003]|uniref:nucleoside triphosphate pyrophosphohydrolase n=1 Tax=Thalassobacillus sp. CUG 92003 TaxID=2736641 RepID=UPI0015E7D46A|nr:nucleoside triphosphate pyrophosphohydrolase [Thalassobacillus sp. CUG 92003]
MHSIEIIGLGGGDIDQLPLGLYKKLISQAQPVYVRTEDHPVVAALETEGVTFKGFDETYQRHDQFEPVYQDIVEQLIQASETQAVIYAVPGHPMLAERTVQLLLEHGKETDLHVTCTGGRSFLDDLFNALQVDPIEGFQLLDATSFKRNQLDYRSHLIFCQVYDKMIASEVKLSLLDDLAPETPVTIVSAAGSNEETRLSIPLEELDRAVELDNLTTVHLAPITDMNQLNHQFFRLREVISELRGPDGCPWDRAQTHESLRKYLIEETYEFIDAVNRADDVNMTEELGDILLQVLLHSQIGEDEGFFTVDDVIVTVTDKMIRRHPHVFGDHQAETAEDVVQSWDAIKQNEKSGQHVALLDHVPKSFPALLQAEEIQKKAAKVGFDWGDPVQVIRKVEEEWQEFEVARRQQNVREMEKEWGDLLFALANLARHYKLSSESSLEQTNAKFRKRFAYVEKKVVDSGHQWHDFTLDELDGFWERAKAEYKGEE